MKDTRANRIAFFQAWKAERACVDCGWLRDPDHTVPAYVGKDADHVDPATKARDEHGNTIKPSRVAKEGPWDRMVDELDNCVVRCSRCHGVKTWKNGDHLRRGQ